MYFITRYCLFADWGLFVRGWRWRR